MICQVYLPREFFLLPQSRLIGPIVGLIVGLVLFSCSRKEDVKAEYDYPQTL